MKYKHVEKMEIIQMVEQYGISYLTVFSGLLLGEEKLKAFANADLFLFPSKTENFALAMFEAMACHIPVVISDTLNMADKVREAGAGLVISREPQAFADAILELLSNPEQRKEMGENGFRLAQDYCWESTGEKLARTIETILRGVSLPEDLSPQLKK